MNPIEAVTHPDPYPYYKTLVERSIYRDEELSMWVAASAESVTEVLTSDACRVRPPGSASDGIFRELARVNDGAHHRALKDEVMTITGALDAARVAEVSRMWASRLADDMEEFAFAMPVRVMATLLSVEDVSLSDVRAFANALFSGGASTPTDRPACRPALLGLLAQTLDATAGLIGNTMLALADGAPPARRLVRQRLAGAAGPAAGPAGRRPAFRSLRDAIEHVIRFDPPIHNTRRFVAEDSVIAGMPMRAGDAILVVLAAANRDPRANGRVFTFGLGPHACPGQELAVTIAEAAVVELRRRNVISTPPLYHPSRNARIALLRSNQ